MAHDHAHDHGTGHSHAPASFGAAFAIAAVLNVVLVIVQVIYGLSANSLALLADAGHNFGDCLGLVLAWGAHVLARRRPTARFTYGFGSASILSALVNAVTLLVATGGIAWEAIRRLSDPGEVAGGTVIIVAAAGIAVNGVSAWLLMAGRKGDLNIRGAFLHLVGDAAVSAAVVVAGVVILLTGWTVIDPIASLVVAAAILWSSWSLLRESFRLSLDAVPSGIEPEAVRAFLEGLPGVTSTHDLHIWAMSTTGTALTCHLVMPTGHPGDAFLANTCHELDHRFAISHATLQIEVGDADLCRLEPSQVV
ncbi:MAG: cation diffusion facilitator family transporter [Alphaproteobacteria bacterium]